MLQTKELLIFNSDKTNNNDKEVTVSVIQVLPKIFKVFGVVPQ